MVVFSGIWPYAKNLILVYSWYAPLTVEKRTSVLTWLLRLSKYTLVDVFAVVAILVGVQLELNVAGASVITRAEPRPAIIAFFVATLWEFAQIEWTVYLHNQHIYSHDGNDDDDPGKVKDTEEGESSGDTGNRISNGTDGSHTGNEGSTNDDFLMAMRFRTKMRSNKDSDSIPPINRNGIVLWMIFLLVATVITYVVGAVSELLRFESTSIVSPVPCIKSYNLISFANALINDMSLSGSDAPAGTWTLYIAYILLVVLLPILIHIFQTFILVVSIMSGMNKDGKAMARYNNLCHTLASFNGFAGIEVLLIGIYAIQHKFDEFVTEIAGEGNAQFFSIMSKLGPAFSIFIVYSFTSGFLQYFIHCCETEYYKIDPYHKVNLVWTKLFGCWLQKKNS